MTANNNILQASPIEPVITGPMINRREFLTYAWGATLALLAVEGAVTSYVFLAPRFRAGEFGGKFSLGSAGTLPTIEAAPQPNAAGKFWLVNTDEGTRAIYMVCTHLGCLYKWNDEADRFQCPCHGSEFTREGDYIKGPAPRSLDQFIVEVLDEGETIAATAETEAGANPPTIARETAQLVVNTGKRINGQPRNLSPAIEHT